MVGATEHEAAEFCIGPGRLVVSGVVVAILAVGIWQITKLKAGDPSPGSSILWPDSTYNQDQAFINKNFKASSEDFILYFEGEKGAVYDPAVYQTFKDFDEHMANALPDIYKFSDSIINLAAMVNYSLRDGHPLYYQLPSNPIELTGLLGYLRMDLGQSTLSSYMDLPGNGPR